MKNKSINEADVQPSDEVQPEQLTPDQFARVAQIRSKKGLATLTGTPADKVVISPTESPKKFQTEEYLAIIERVVGLLQRRKRAVSLKRRESKMERRREMLKPRIATKQVLMQRAMRMAKQMIRRKVAGNRGSKYKQLGSTEKINIDRQLEPRAKQIKKLAMRLMQRVRSGEMKRLQAVQSGKSTKGVYGNIQRLNQEYTPIYSNVLGEHLTREDINAAFQMTEATIGQNLKSIAGAPFRVVGKTALGIMGTGAVLNAISTPQGAKTAAQIAGAWTAHKLSGLGAVDKTKAASAASDKHTKIMQGQAQAQSIEGTKQQQIKTKQQQLAYDQQKTAAMGDIKKTVSQKIGAYNQKMKGKSSIGTYQRVGTQPTKVVKPNTQTDTSSTLIIPPSGKRKPGQPTTTIVSHREWDYESYLQEKADSSLAKKAEKYGVTFEEVKGIFEQGLADYDGRANATPHQFAMQRVNSQLAEGKGLWDNIHAKRARIKSGSDEKMRKPGSEGAPTKQNFIDAQEAVQQKTPHDKFKAGLKKAGYDADKGADRLLALIAKQKAERAEHEKKYAHLYAEENALDESFIVDRPTGYSGVFTAADLGIKIQGGFQLHPSVMEEGGAGDEGTNKLTNKYKKDTPGEQLEAAVRMMRAKRKANTQC